MSKKQQPPIMSIMEDALRRHQYQYGTYPYDDEIIDDTRPRSPLRIVNRADSISITPATDLPPVSNYGEIDTDDLPEYTSQAEPEYSPEGVATGMPEPVTATSNLLPLAFMIAPEELIAAHDVEVSMVANLACCPCCRQVLAAAPIARQPEMRGSAEYPTGMIEIAWQAACGCRWLVVCGSNDGLCEIYLQVILDCRSLL